MRRWLWLLAGAALLVALSCSVFGGANQASEEPEAAATTSVDANAPTATPSSDGGSEPTVAPADDGTLSVDSDALSQLDSYRAVMTWRVEKADGTVEEFSIEQAATRDPAAQQFSMTAADGEGMQVIQIGDQMWMRYGDEWMQTSTDEGSSVEDSFGDFLTTGDQWISDLGSSDYEDLGKETINGVQTRHYRAKYSDAWLGLLAEAGSDGQISDGTADIWISDESDLPKFVVRYLVEMQGTIDGGDATATLSEDVMDINGSFTIEAPQDVAQGGLPDGVPLYPDATDVTTFGTMTMFSSADDVATVNAFYQDALEGAGWTVGDDAMEMEGVATSTWTKDDQTLTMSITTGDNDTGADVMFSIETAE
jgi:hypothetical protein